MKRQNTMRSDLLELRSRIRSRIALAYGILVLVVALNLNIIFLNPVELGDYASAGTASAYADVSTDVDAEINASAIRAKEIWDPDNFNISWSEGEYSEVFQGFHVGDNESCVLKILKPVKERRVKREIKILQDLTGGPNIITLLDVAKDYQNKTLSIVFEHVNHTYHKTLYPTFHDVDVRYYVFKLLEALEFSHAKGIMHRDIKPHNVMIDHPNRKLRLIDWGLADFYYEGKEYATSVASTYWRSPELLVDYEEYNPSVDMWSVGCMLAGLIFQKEPFFRGKSDVDQLVKISKVLGSEDLFKYLHKYNIELDEEFDDVSGWHLKQGWGSFVNSKNRRLVSEDGLDLLDRLLRYDHNERLTAKQAIAHPYFDPVRSR